MKHIPMLYSTTMVQALIANRKTKTRRTKALEEVNKRANDWVTPLQMPCTSDGKWVFTAEHGEAQQLRIKCPYGKVGDVIWVRETFCPTGSDEYLNKETNKPFFYLADVEQEYLPSVNASMADYGWKWKPNLHMPKLACRIFLEIVSVKVERLQDITEEDAIAEGVEQIADYGTTGYKLYTQPDAAFSDIDAKWSFESLWQSINGEQSWNDNPWVWVIEFKQIDKPANFLN